jgi:hypothetical protein
MQMISSITLATPSMACGPRYANREQPLGFEGGEDQKGYECVAKSRLVSAKIKSFRSYEVR